MFVESHYSLVVICFKKKNENIHYPLPCSHPFFISIQKDEVITCPEKRRRHERARLFAYASGSGVDYDGSFAASYALFYGAASFADIRKDG